MFACDKFLDIEIFGDLLFESTTDQKKSKFCQVELFPVRLSHWVHQQIINGRFPQNPKFSDFLKMSVDDLLNVPKLGSTTVNSLIRYLSCLESESQNNEKFRSLVQSNKKIANFNSGQNFLELFDLDRLRNYSIDLIWISTDEVRIGSNRFTIFPKIPKRIFNLFKDSSKCVNTFGQRIDSFEDFFSISPREISRIKGISSQSVEEFMSHLVWLEAVLKSSSQKVSIYDSFLGIFESFSEVEKLVLRNRNPFSRDRSFREIKEILEIQLDISISTEMCRQKMQSIEKLLIDALNGPYYFKLNELFLKLNRFIVPEKTIKKCKEFVNDVLVESEKQKGHERSWEADHVLFCLGLFSICQKDLRIINQKVFILGSELKNFLDEIFSDQNLKLLSDVEVFCTNNSLDQDSFLRGLDSELVCVVGDYLVKRKPMINLFEAAIRTSERALTVQEASKQFGIGVNMRSMRNVLAEDRRFVRVSKDEFSLREFGQSNYEGIASEMEKALNASGKTLLSALQGKLQIDKGINPTSVQFFSRAPVFLVENGFISLRKESQPLRVHPKVFDGESILLDNGKVEVRFLCNRDLLRGSSLPIDPGTSALLGVQPGGTRVFMKQDLAITISWSKYQQKPRVSTLRNLAQSLGAHRSNVLCISFDVSETSFDAHI